MVRCGSFIIVCCSFIIVKSVITNALTSNIADRFKMIDDSANCCSTQQRVDRICRYTLATLATAAALASSTSLGAAASASFAAPPASC